MKLGNLIRFAAVLSALMLAFTASPVLAGEEETPPETTETDGDTTPPADQDDSGDEE